MYKDRDLNDMIIGSLLTIILTIALSVIVCGLYIELVGFPRDYATDHDGIFSGFFHGYFLVFNFIVSLFKDDVAIYQDPNTGTPYLIGFIIGVLWGFRVSKGLPALATVRFSRS